MSLRGIFRAASCLGMTFGVCFWAPSVTAFSWSSDKQVPYRKFPSEPQWNHTSFNF